MYVAIDLKRKPQCAKTSCVLYGSSKNCMDFGDYWCGEPDSAAFVLFYRPFLVHYTNTSHVGLIRTVICWCWSRFKMLQELFLFLSKILLKFLKELLFSNTTGTPEELLSLLDVSCQFNLNSFQLLRIPNHKSQTHTPIPDCD